MPCRTYDDDHFPRVDPKELDRLRNTEALLCGISTVLEARDSLETVLKLVDWKAVGMTKNQFIQWWEDHKAKDAARRDREQIEAERKAAKARAVAKLTSEERVLLGIRDDE